MLISTHKQCIVNWLIANHMLKVVVDNNSSTTIQIIFGFLLFCNASWQRDSIKQNFKSSNMHKQIWFCMQYQTYHSISEKYIVQVHVLHNCFCTWHHICSELRFILLPIITVADDIYKELIPSDLVEFPSWICKFNTWSAHGWVKLYCSYISTVIKFYCM